MHGYILKAGDILLHFHGPLPVLCSAGGAALKGPYQMIIQKMPLKATLCVVCILELACPVPNARRYTLLVYLSGRVAESPAQSPALQQANSKAGAAGRRAKQEAQGKICQGQEQQHGQQQQQQQPEAMSNEAIQDLVSAS